MTRRIAVSSFSVWEDLGGLRIPIQDERGDPAEIVLERPRRVDLLDFPRLARERFDVTDIEICQIQIRDSSPPAIDALATSLDDAGVRLLNLPIDADGAEATRWLDIAGRLGASYCRIRANFDWSAEAVASSLTSFVRLASRAKESGIELLVENQGGISEDLDRYEDFLDLLIPLGVGLLLDTGNIEPLMSQSNARTGGEIAPHRPWNTRELDRVHRTVARLAPRAVALHAKANGFDADGEHVPVDLRAILTTVADSGFDGPVTVEYEGMVGDRWNNTARTLELVRSVFSGTRLDSA
ncbi:sugar phosphate isomerase/epimerase family protein [Leifsonia sp. NPDC058194]|uniref:sugar phosphate isomerase/epimerase family protein n=1 Tax=Leifsonia sp. NPDC058194 TaxID=3346374 RepID=UPI0036D8FCD8